MSKAVIGLRDPHGEKHQKMVTAAKALHEAGISDMPEKMKKYFNLTEIGEVMSNLHAGCEVDLGDALSDTSKYGGCAEYVVDLNHIPADITHIRFFSGWE